MRRADDHLPDSGILPDVNPERINSRRSEVDGGFAFAGDDGGVGGAVHDG